MEFVQAITEMDLDDSDGNMAEEEQEQEDGDDGPVRRTKRKCRRIVLSDTEEDDPTNQCEDEVVCTICTEAVHKTEVRSCPRPSYNARILIRDLFWWQ